MRCSTSKLTSSFDLAHNHTSYDCRSNYLDSNSQQTWLKYMHLYYHQQSIHNSQKNCCFLYLFIYVQNTQPMNALQKVYFQPMIKILMKVHKYPRSEKKPFNIGVVSYLQTCCTCFFNKLVHYNIVYNTNHNLFIHYVNQLKKNCKIKL